MLPQRILYSVRWVQQFQNDAAGSCPVTDAGAVGAFLERLATRRHLEPWQQQQARDALAEFSEFLAAGAGPPIPAAAAKLRPAVPSVEPRDATRPAGRAHAR